jgi:accessory gene regulator protein AgrB
MASFSLAAILQALIRTIVMGVVAVFVTRYWITVLIAVAFLAFVAYRVRIVHGAPNTDDLNETLQSLLIARLIEQNI